MAHPLGLVFEPYPAGICPCCGGRIFIQVAACGEGPTVRLVVDEVWCENCLDWSNCGVDAA